MSSDVQSVEIDPQILFYVASNDEDIWQLLIGHEASHFLYGTGKVRDILYVPGESPYIRVQFFQDQSTRDFVAEAFSDGKFQAVTVSALAANRIDDKLAEAEAEIERAKMEREAQIRFQKLKVRYLVSRHREKTPVSLLYKILLQLDAGEDISDKEIGWLKAQGLYPPIAFFYERQFAKSVDLWHCVLASSNWRKAGYPKRAVKITEAVESNNPRLLSAVLTTRGGAFRDLKKTG